MDSLVLNPVSKQKLDTLSLNLPQAILLSGKSGIGLLTIARHLSRKHPETYVIGPKTIGKTGTIGQIAISTIRELYDITRSVAQSPGRVVIIDDAETMTVSAQNAFLKLLEEPNQTTSFILTSHTPEQLLPTILSRVQKYPILPATQAQTSKLLSVLPIPKEVSTEQLEFIALGKPAELRRLTSNKTYLNERLHIASLAKKLIEEKSYDIQVAIQKEKPSRQTALDLIEMMTSFLSHKPSEATTQQLERLIEAYDRIEQGGNVQLQLLRAVV